MLAAAINRPDSSLDLLKLAFRMIAAKQQHSQVFASLANVSDIMLEEARFLFKHPLEKKPIRYPGSIRLALEMGEMSELAQLVEKMTTIQQVQAEEADQVLDLMKKSAYA